ncbi:hypothetical protein [Pararhizobium sp.]
MAASAAPDNGVAASGLSDTAIVLPDREKNRLAKRPPATYLRRHGP